MSSAIALIADFGKVKFPIGLSGYALITDRSVEPDFHAEPLRFICFFLLFFLCVAANSDFLRIVGKSIINSI